MAFSAIPLFYYKEFYMNVQPKLENYNLETVSSFV